MDAIRNGNFTSSEIFRLLKSGQKKGTWSKDVDTYIRECNQERRLGRSIEVQSDARPLTWGKLVEQVAFDNVGLEYTMCSNKTLVHPKYPYWCGSPDAYTETKVPDLKCPMTLTSFCNLVDAYEEDGKVVHEALTIEAMRENHKDGDKFYWQVVSNAILLEENLGRPYNTGQIIVYVPYLDELDKIKSLANQSGDPKYYWIWSADDDYLPWIHRGGMYKNINVIEFNIPQHDKDLLIERVVECGKQLIKL